MVRFQPEQTTTIKGVTMDFRKVFLVIVLLLAAVLLASPGFSQDKAEKVISFSGLIQTAAKDSTFIVVNEVKVVVSGATIVNDSGNILGMGDLKPKLYVTVEAVKRSDGFLARKVTVISSSKIPKEMKKVF
jgi:hypothetical protein